MKRRTFLRNSGLAAAALSAVPSSLVGCQRQRTDKLMLMRYDTEWWGEPEEMDGFLEKLVEIHRQDHIPVTMFCKGETVQAMEDEFRAFYQEVKNDPLFDIQDHSYTHIGLGYERGKPVDVLEADYIKSFNVHERIFGKRPVGISRCGTSVDGPSLSGFDVTEKSREEFEMVVKLGTRMIDAFLTGIDGSRQFINYDMLGHPEVMGFISGFSDTAWMDRRETGDPVDYMIQEIKIRSGRREHMPVMFHDWVAWQKAADKELTHVRRIAEEGKRRDYQLVTHLDCYHNKRLWQKDTY